MTENPRGMCEGTGHDRQHAQQTESTDLLATSSD
jgi:hypothetical protein